VNVPGILFAVVLVLSALTAWVVAARAKAFVRPYVRFASVLYVALAIASLVPDEVVATGAFARAVALVVCVLAPATLSLALVALFRKPVTAGPAAIWLTVCCLGGIGAAISDVPALGFVPLVLGAGAALFASLRMFAKSRVAALQGALASLAFLCAAASLMTRAPASRAALILFSAAGLLGTTLALVRGSRPNVEKERRRDLSRVLAVGDDR
jgi:hypothetical protein